MKVAAGTWLLLLCGNDSGEDVGHDVAVDVGEAVIASEVPPGQAFVIEAEKVEDCCMEVVEVDLSGDRTEPELIGFPVHDAAFDSASGHPGAEAFGLMFAAMFFDGSSPAEVLAPWCSSELAAPDHEGVVEETARLEVEDECGTGQVASSTAFGEAATDIAMMVPSIHGDLDEADAGFAEAPCEETCAAIPVGRFFSDSVEFFGGIAFLRDVHEIGCGRLHAERGLEAIDHALHLSVACISGEQASVHALDEVEAVALGVAIGGGVFEEIDGGVGGF